MSEKFPIPQIEDDKKTKKALKKESLITK